MKDSYVLVQILHKNGGRAVFSDRDVPIFQEVWQVSNLDHFYQGRPSNQNQAFPFPGGFSDTRSLSDPPPSRRPLQLHPSPIVEGQRKILTVKKPAGCQPTFATLNLDGAPPPTPPPPPPPSSMQPPPCSYNCAEKRFFDHCLDFGKCFYLYLDHNGCNCFDDVDDDFCAVCELREDVRYKFPRFPTST